MPHADPEAARAYFREYQQRRRAEDPERVRGIGRKSLLKRRFGITPQDYDAMLKAQGGVCAICGTADPSPWEWLCVDHCHSTNTVRGLLCAHCNNMLGHARDKPETLRAAISYLERQ